jgi:PKD domain
MTALQLAAAAACLAACGGGATDSAIDAQTDNAAMDSGGAMVTALGTAAWKKVADEGGSFTLSTATTVRYGSTGAWIKRTVTGPVQCTNAFFGRDPAPKVKKECDVSAALADSNVLPPTTTAGTGTTTPPADAGVAPVTPPASVPVQTVTISSLAASLVPTRTTGVAPLAVLFDATATSPMSKTNTIDLFRQVKYAFNFGDERGEVWPVSNVSKNVQTGGPIAAHVFTVPGTYDVSVTTTEPLGTISTKTVSITVQDPAVVYAGTKTVCVSAVSDFAGCPTGAAKATSLPNVMNGLRVLLHTGESFGDINLQDGNTGVTVSSYGTGAKPTVATVGVGSWRPATTNFANDITVMNLNVAGNVTQSIGSRVLFYRNTLTSTNPNNSGLYFGNIGYWAGGDPYRQVPASAFQHAREIFVVENSITSTPSGAIIGIYGDGANVAVLGNTLGSFQQHNMRLVKTYRSIVAHNELRGVSADGIRHALKVHSGGLTPYNPSYSVSGDSWATRDLVIANNKFGSAGDNNPWTVAICPQNDQVAEGVERVMINNNTFVKGGATVQSLSLGGRLMTYRDNAVVGTTSLSEGTCHVGGLPADWNGPYFSN